MSNVVVSYRLVENSVVYTVHSSTEGYRYAGRKTYAFPVSSKHLDWVEATIESLWNERSRTRRYVYGDGDTHLTSANEATFLVLLNDVREECPFVEHQARPYMPDFMMASADVKVLVSDPDTGSGAELSMHKAIMDQYLSAIGGAPVFVRAVLRWIYMDEAPALTRKFATRFVALFAAHGAASPKARALVTRVCHAVVWRDPSEGEVMDLIRVLDRYEPEKLGLSFLVSSREECYAVVMCVDSSSPHAAHIYGWLAKHVPKHVEAVVVHDHALGARRLALLTALEDAKWPGSCPRYTVLRSAMKIAISMDWPKELEAQWPEMSKYL